MANLDVPAWVVYLGVGLASFFCYVAVYIGKQSGKRPKPEVEIAGALVDASAIRELTAEIRAHHTAMDDASHHVGRKFEGLSEQVKSLSAEVQQLRIEVAIHRKQ